ncbi:Zn-ribbon domain-containing OB-fold protein [Tateyamaria pelophila]|uniref:Zn-ribbon domain-containing OB-fold protein n=1 Tax=Tateyamaria pelophila TaxID=328415 RepID=UPI001CC0306B|nr:zinc ribbon domain-containing protein [Tateyamaria pelophila]
MISYPLSLNYSLAPGWLEPFVSGLETGAALARKCDACAAVSFPPLRVCPCGATDATWVTLPGTARIELRTYGSDGAFGLVRFDGADTRATVRLVDIAPDEETGRIMASDAQRPMLCLTTMTAKEVSHG